jgi:Mor family transcriptional regulator
MTRDCNRTAIEEAFTLLHRNYGNLAPHIINDLVLCFGGLRLTFPDLQDLYREERNRRIRREFTGFNYEELAIKYRLKGRQVRRILMKSE